MKATQVLPTHGFFVVAAKQELIKVIHKNRISATEDEFQDFLRKLEELDSNSELGFFVGLDGVIELGEEQEITLRGERESIAIEPFEFTHLQQLIYRHREILRDPNVQKILFADSARVPNRINRKLFCGYREFASLEHFPSTPYEDWDDDTLAWQILRTMDQTIVGNEANHFNELEAHWLERRDNYISINAKVFPTFDVTLSELRARRARADELIADLERLLEFGEEAKARIKLAGLDDDTVLEICYLDFHSGKHRVTKLAGVEFLSRLPDTDLLFN